ncbi:MAG TPA: DUF1844 domain-containing protein [Chthoniobacterales bacterium]
MAEVQTTTQSGEMTQRFIEFVMMQAQNAALFLGQIPNPQTGKAEVNLEVARMFIDQLAMIEEKTRGNLSKDETTVLRNALSSLQMAFVEASQNAGRDVASTESTAAGSRATEQPAPATDQAAPGDSEAESRKKFTKSYGA